VANWVTSPSKGLPIPPEADRMPAGVAICIYGEEETDSTCPGLRPDHTRSIRLPGGHHFDRDYDKLARLILGATRPVPHQAR
jgi:type IV secretory pathway VirJ component